MTDKLLLLFFLLAFGAQRTDWSHGRLNRRAIALWRRRRGIVASDAATQGGLLTLDAFPSGWKCHYVGYPNGLMSPFPHRTYIPYSGAVIRGWAALGIHAPRMSTHESSPAWVHERITVMSEDQARRTLVRFREEVAAASKSVYALISPELIDVTSLLPIEPENAVAYRQTIQSDPQHVDHTLHRIIMRVDGVVVDLEQGYRNGEPGPDETTQLMRSALVQLRGLIDNPPTRRRWWRELVPSFD